MAGFFISPHHSPLMAADHDGERPRERLLSRGPAALTDAELIAILLRTGVRGEPVADLAAGLLRELGGLRGLLAAPAQRLLERRGLSFAKAATLLAAAELARRLLAANAPAGPVTTAAQAAPHLLPLFVGLQRESFGVLFLDGRHRPLAAELLFNGGIGETPVFPGEIARRALSHAARAVVLAHNHPSGDLTPSPEDGSVTQRVEAALKLLDIRCLDHIIVNGERWKAMRG